MKILITGAAGQLANFTIDYIKEFAPEVELFGLVRTAEQARKLEERGVTPKLGDYSNKTSLVSAFTDMDRVLFISVPNHELQVNVVEAAKEAEVPYIAYTSINGIEYIKGGLEVNHRATEKLIKESGIKHTFLRNSWYLEMEEVPLKAAIATGNYYYLSEGKISYATRQEYAEAARVIISEEFFPEVLELGRTAFTHVELAHALEEATGKKLNIMQVNVEKYNENLSPFGASGFESFMQQYVAAGNNGESDVVATDMELSLIHI